MAKRTPMEIYANRPKIEPQVPNDIRERLRDLPERNAASATSADARRRKKAKR
jgi:hypothetical protein